MTKSINKKIFEKYIDKIKNKDNYRLVFPKNKDKFEYGIFSIVNGDLFGKLNKKEEIIKFDFKIYQLKKDTNLEQDFFDIFIDKPYTINIEEDKKEDKQQEKNKVLTPEEMKKRIIEGTLFG